MTIGQAVRKILSQKRKQFPQGDYGHYLWEGKKFYNKRTLALAVRATVEQKNNLLK